MKRLLSVVLFLTIATTAFAQLMPSVGFGVHGNFMNANFPGPSINGASALKDVYGAGFGGGAHLDIHLAMLSLRVSGDYLSFSPDNDKYKKALESIIGTAAGQFTVDGGGITMWSGNLNAKMQILPLPIIKPYITGGVGFAKLSVDEAKVMQGGVQTLKYAGFASDTQTAWNVGAGVDLSIGITLFLEVKYMWVMTSPQTSTLVPVTVGITF